MYFREEDGQWVEEQKLEEHSDWVRDVAWAPSIGLPKSIIASCSQVYVSISSWCVNSARTFSTLCVTYDLLW